MHFTPYLVALAAYLTVASAVAGSDADSSQLQRRITDPGNPANLVNCEPGGGTDSCNLEKPVIISLYDSPSMVLIPSTVQPHPD